MRTAQPETQTGLGARTTLALLFIGLFGQVAWTIENMYFNVFLYNAILPDTRLIALMVAASAVAATLTTLFMGALSDRLGRRRMFITLGYLLWGISIIAFRFLVPKSGASAQVLRRLALLVVGLDCVMTFFGSTANDAAFNAWVTDVTKPQNRGRAQGLLAMLPLLSMLLVFGLLDPLTQQGRWADFFLIVGLATMLAGLLGLALIKEPALTPAREPVMSTIAYGFQKSVVRKNPVLYLSLLALLVHGVATQVYMPYLIIYLQTYLGIRDYALLLALVLLGASALSLLSGRLIDRFGKARSAFPGTMLALAGLAGMVFARRQAALLPFGILTIGGTMVAAACLNGLVQDGIPAGMGGRFQGVRMIFAVMLPMVIGPAIGSLVSRGSAQEYTELGVTRQAPTPMIFLAALVVMLLVFPLLRLLYKKEKAHDSAA